MCDVNERACWICRRTEKELLEQARKDEMSEYIFEENVLIKISDMYDCDYTKFICPTCEYLVNKILESGLKGLINDDCIHLKFEE